MKTSVLLLFTLLLFCFSSCDDGANSLTVAQIVGTDPGACPCCGGYFILISNDGTPTTYRFFDADLPAGSTVLDAPVTFPLDVELEWENQSDFCNGISRISIKQIARR